MPTDPTVWSYIIHAGPVVKIVMLILLLASIASWTLIFQRFRQFKHTTIASKEFEKEFWSGTALNTLYDQQLGSSLEQSGLSHIFQAGFNEFHKLREHSTDAQMQITGSERAMRIATAHESATLEKHLAFLATVGSNSVYIGLFGTVWGIMSSFSALGSATSATLQMVAPGISEALIATAMGLVAAIPAVIAYNYFTNQLDRLESHFQIFSEEFSTILQHQSPS